MYLKFKNGKSKALTLSYDDGVVQDIRLIDILNQYKIKGTFNLNTGRFLPDDTKRERFYGRLTWAEAKALYTNSGHEVAIHTVSHPFLEKLDSPSVLREVLEDRETIEREFGVIARGMAYPFGTYSQEVVEDLKRCGITYSRTVESTHRFDLPEDWLLFHPTCHHKDPELMELAKKFVEKKPVYPAHNYLFALWGHSFEFDNQDNWHIIEDFCRYMGGREDIWYCTNSELYDYVKAYEALQSSLDGSMVYNPTASTVWFYHRKALRCIQGGETLHFE